jgi:hypothetical protein
MTKEERYEYNKSIRLANPEKARQYVRDWAKNNPNKKKESNQKSARLHPEKEKARKQKWRKANPDKIKSIRLKTRFGITLESFNDMFNNQNGRCLICDLLFDHSKKKTMPHVDHNHDTKKVRGLLCHGCNIILGFCRDNPAILTKAVTYLRGDLV